MSYNIGPKIGIDGEKEFRDQIKKINNAYKTLEAETKAATAAFEANDDEQGKLKKTSTQLQKQIELQKQKVSLLADAVAKATDKFGSESDEVTRLKGVLYDAQAKMSGLEGELKDVDRRLKESVDSVEEFGEETDQAAEKVVDFGDILAANFLSDMLMDGLQELAGNLKDIASESIQAAADVQAETAQFEQTFGDLSETATGALQKISDKTNIAVTRLQGSYTKMFAFAKTAGADQAAAMDISSRALEAAADSAAYYDRSIEDTLESLQAFLKGNYANDAALGMEDGQLYINASLIKTGSIQSKDGKTIIDIGGEGGLTTYEEDGSKIQLNDGNLRIFDSDGNIRFQISRRIPMFGSYMLAFYSSDGKLLFGIEDFLNKMVFWAPAFDGSGTVVREIAWKDNGDGTSTLIGIEQE